MPSFGPLSSAPLSALPDDVPEDPLQPNLSDSALVSSELTQHLLNVLEDTGNITNPEVSALIINYLADSAYSIDAVLAALVPRVTASDTAGVADDAEAKVLDNLVSSVVAYASADARGVFRSALSDAGTFEDAVAAAWNMLLADTAATSATLEGQVKKLAEIAETLLALGAVDSRLTALIAVSVAAALEGRVSAGWAAEAVDQAALTDETRGILSALIEAADSAAIADGASGGLSVLVLASDAGSATDAATTNLSALMDLSDGAVVFCTIRLDGLDYQGWVINTDLRALTEYRNVPFDSFAILNGRTYAAGENGIFELAGTTDDGAPIDAWITPFLTDFGTQKFKRVSDIWIGGMGQDLYVKVHSRDPATGVKTEDLYSVVRKQDAGAAPGRVEVGRGIKSTYFGLSLHNVDGADFELDSIDWRPLILDRRN